MGRSDGAPAAQVAGPALFGPLGVQPRDLRLLDWKHAAMYPSALLCREAALMAVLEHVKCIITRSAVLVMATDQPAVLGCATGLHPLSALGGSLAGPRPSAVKLHRAIPGLLAVLARAKRVPTRDAALVTSS